MECASWIDIGKPVLIRTLHYMRLMVLKLSQLKQRSLSFMAIAGAEVVRSRAHKRVYSILYANVHSKRFGAVWQGWKLWKLVKSSETSIENPEEPPVWSLYESTQFANDGHGLVWTSHASGWWEPLILVGTWCNNNSPDSFSRERNRDSRQKATSLCTVQM